VVFNGKNGKIVNAIYADVGPSNKIGEGSIALAEALGIPSSPRTGGVSSGIMYVVFPGSGNGKPRLLSEINSEAEKHFNNWGGMARLNACFSPS
jgi:RecA/RadA recombinase